MRRCIVRNTLKEVLVRAVWRRGLTIKELDSAEALLEETLTGPHKAAPQTPLLTTRREALSLYREILRCARFFEFADSSGVVWRDRLVASARREFEDARFETDPEVVTRLLVNGREALKQTVDKLVEKVSQLNASENEKPPFQSLRKGLYGRWVMPGRAQKQLKIVVRSAELPDFSQELDNPDFDDLVLDEAFYKRIGEDKELLEKYPPWAPEATDPKGYNVSFEEYLQNRPDIPDYIKSDLKDAQYFGPPIVLLAGFRAEELPMIRTTVDTLLGQEVKVVPVYGTEMLSMRVEEALEMPEPKWSEPRPANWTRGGTWGSQRTIVFSGLPMESQAAVVEFIEESGLPPVCCTIASAETRHMKLGQLLADAIKFQRDRKNPEKDVFQSGGRFVDDVTDLESYFKEKIVERVQTVRDGLESGEAQLEEDENGRLKVKMNGLKEEILNPEEISQPLPSDQPISQTDSAAAHQGDASSEQVQWDGERDAVLKDESSEHEPPASGIEDFFALDDLIFEELGMEHPKSAPEEPSPSPPPERPPPATDDQEPTKSGNVYEINTKPEELEDGVKRSTVFSGLVQDPTSFMKDNFGYDTNKGGITPSTEGDEITTFDITSLAEQEALADPPPMEDTPEPESDLADVIQSAIDKGVDPAELKAMIDAMSPQKAPSRRPRFSRRRRSRG